MNLITARKPVGISAGIVLLVAVAFVAKQEAKAGVPAGTKEVAIVGTNHCLGCALKKEHGAKAQCGVYGHRHSLKVEKAMDADGNELARLKGRTLGYLENDNSAKLVKGEVFHGARVEVKGRLYEQESVIEVTELKEP